MKASDLFVKCLENEGVKYVFGLPGEENEDLLFSLEKSSVQFIPTRHEQGAAFMADVWGRLTGKAGVCLATLGPGATNLITGIADAYLDKSPLVAITGQAGLHRAYKESHQFLDIVNIFKPITKWNTNVPQPDAIPEIIRQAFKTAEAEKPGATHIELSEDIAAMKASSEVHPVGVTTVRRSGPDYKALERALSLLKKAKRPLILAGNGAIRKLASNQLRRLVEKFEIPVVNTFMGQGAVSDKSPCSLLSIGLNIRDIVMDAVDDADLILSIGYDITEYSPEAWNPKQDKKIIHIDFMPAEVYTHYQPDVEIVADIAATLWEINEAFDKEKVEFDRQWYRPVRQRIIEDIEGYDLKEGEPFTVPGVLNVLRSLMAEEDLLISDVGVHKIWIARNFRVYCPNGCLISNGLATMGFALPGGIAAALANPERRIVAAMGDGGFLMNSQELETAKRLGVAFTSLIFNDNDYGMISWKQRMDHDHATGTGITNPDFKKYVESFGIKAYAPKTLTELKRDLKEALESKTLCTIEVPVNPSVNLELVQKLKKRKKGLSR